MNLVPKTRRAPSMRIIALPLAELKTSRNVKQKPCPEVNANTTPVFYHFDLVSPYGREDSPWHQKALKDAISKATEIWTSLGKAPKGSWKLWTYGLGERLADRIDFEELALRNVDPSLGPTVPLTTTNKQDNDTSKNTNRPQLLPKIPLVYPPSLYPTYGPDRALHPSIAHLHTLLANRGPRHRRGFYFWMLIAPLTFPITLIPIIPNLPFFFCIWRSWSHYTAYRSSQYLSSLVVHGLIEPSPSSDLDKLYVSFTPCSRTLQTSQNLPSPPLTSEKKPTSGNVTVDRESETASEQGEQGTPQSAYVFFAHEGVPSVLKLFGLPESTAKSMHRAVDQTRGRLGK